MVVSETESVELSALVEDVVLSELASVVLAAEGVVGGCVVAAAEGVVGGCVVTAMKKRTDFIIRNRVYCTN